MKAERHPSRPTGPHSAWAAWRYARAASARSSPTPGCCSRRNCPRRNGGRLKKTCAPCCRRSGHWGGWNSSNCATLRLRTLVADWGKRRWPL
ncbi:hypothetical protein ACPA9J_01935 [Pseudomonas aeruginosa]